MMAARATGVAVAIALVIWLMLDSGVFQPRAARITSAALLILAAIFGASAWAGTVTGQRARTPLLAGLAVGVGGYALARLVLF